MPAATYHFRFGLKTLFTIVTCVSVLLGVYAWSLDAFVTLLPCSVLAVGMAAVRRRSGPWQEAFAFGTALGIGALILTLGLLAVTAVRPEVTSRGLTFRRSGALFSDYGHLGITYSVVVCSGMVLVYGIVARFRSRL